MTSGTSPLQSPPPLEPLRDYLLVSAKTDGASTMSGFVLPSSTLGQPSFAEVHRVGKDVADSFGMGDVIVYKQTDAASIYLDGNEYLLVKASAVMGKMDSGAS